MIYITPKYIGNVLINLIIFLLLIAVYTYIQKIEKSGCECAEYKYRDFLKYYSIFSIFFLGITTIIPIDYILDTFGDIVASIFAFVSFIFYITSIVYFFIILDYTRFLIKEKCKCSEDFRRELIMIGSLIEIVIMVVILLVIIILPILLSSVTIVVNNIGTVKNEFSNTMKNPYSSSKKVKSNFIKGSKLVYNIAKESSRGLKNIIKNKKK